MAMQPDPKLQPATAQDGNLHAVGGDGQQRRSTKPETWLALAQAAYRGSTEYYNNNYRKAWEDSIRAFYGQHPTSSKYNSPSYAKRSTIYRPRTRTVIRKNEAAGAAAFFSNMDVVSVTSQDQSSKAQAASAAVMKEILQYRLTKSIPWYLTVLGGLQDAQTVGVVCGHVYWQFEEADEDEALVPTLAQALPPQPQAQPAPPPTAQAGPPVAQPMPQSQPQAPQPTAQPGQPPVAAPGQPPMPPQAQPVLAQPVQPQAPAKHDRPKVDLIPIENLRFDPASDWTDPVNSSPYVIHLMPMRVQEVREKMENDEWIYADDDTILQAAASGADSTRLTRNQNRTDPTDQGTTDVRDYDIVWVQRHIHHRHGQDWEFYTLADRVMLTEAKPLKENILIGRRPYVVGCCILETHKPIPSSIPELGRGLQEETNELANQRLDNIKFALNKAWFAKRGKDVDIVGLVRNVPGRVILLDDPETDVKAQEWQDVTSSSFQEQQNLQMEMDELLGNFNPAAMMQVINANSPAKNMAMLGHASATLVEYLLRTYVETFVQPVLRLLIAYEQEYESDATVIALAAKNAKLFEKYGVNAVSDSMLREELTLTVNVGMGATDPMAKLQKLLLALQSLADLYKTGAFMWANMDEIQKEVYGLLGYSDGSRFMQNDNPQVIMLQKRIQQLLMQMNQLSQKSGEFKMTTSRETNQTRLQIARENNQGKLQSGAMKESSTSRREVFKQKSEDRRTLAGHLVEMHKTNKPKVMV